MINSFFFKQTTKTITHTYKEEEEKKSVINTSYCSFERKKYNIKKIAKINKQKQQIFWFVKFCLHEDCIYTSVKNKKFVRFASKTKQKRNCSKCFIY